MLNNLKKFFAGSASNDETANNSTHDVRVATTALLLELARIDNLFTKTETETILSILKNKYGLSSEHAEALLDEAEKELENSIDHWRFARLINENYTIEEKLDIIETLWRLVFVDGKMDKYEHHLMNKLAGLLRLDHKQLIEKKLKVLHGD